MAGRNGFPESLSGRFCIVWMLIWVVLMAAETRMQAQTGTVAKVAKADAGDKDTITFGNGDTLTGKVREPLNPEQCSSHGWPPDCDPYLLPLFPKAPYYQWFIALRERMEDSKGKREPGRRLTLAFSNRYKVMRSAKR
jgi:hypothetical protein